MKRTLINLFFVVELLFLTTESYSQNNFIQAGDSLSKEVTFHDIDDVIIDINQTTDSWGKPYSSGSGCGFDLNEDKIKDLTIRGSYYFHIVYSSSDIYSVPEPGCSISGNDGPKIYELNERIDDSYKWSNTGSQLVASSNYGINSVKWENVKNKYMAVKILTPSDTLLGWIKLSIIHSSFYHYQAIIKSYALQKNVASQIKENKNEKLFSVFPNPSNNYININIPKLVKENYLTIMGENGQIINKYTIVNPFTHLDISNLKSGIYFLKMSNDEGFEVRKIVKK